MKPVFKPHSVHQQSLFPLNLNDLVAHNHSARLIDSVVEQLEIPEIINQYKGDGTSSYPPKMLLKILFYGYLNNTFSCRKLAKAIEENIYFMWLSGGLKPDFRTINNFRSQKLKGHIDKLFSQMVLLMVDLDLVTLEKQFIDGTKIEANAHKYSFVWKKSVEKNRARLKSKINEVLSDIGHAIVADNQSIDAPNHVDIDSQKLKDKIKQINETTKIDNLTKEQAKSLKKLQNEQLPKLAEYEQHLDILKDRNSHSKIDQDAIFMRMKEDHMRNGQLKAGYNVQISTEKQFITHYSIHQKPTDTTTLAPHLTSFKEAYGHESEQIVADAGYGSEENYQSLEDKAIDFFIPYNMYRKEQKRAFKKDIFHTQNLFYNDAKDYLVCPMGQHMERMYTYKKRTSAGYEQTIAVYEAKNCTGCPLRGLCHKGKEDRRVEVNHNLKRLKIKAKEFSESPTGQQLYPQRCIEPEPVFGNLKQNKKFKRFTMRSLPKVAIEFGLMAIAHNLAKWHTQTILTNLSQMCRQIGAIVSYKTTYKLA
jgi:transposase